MHRPHWHAQVEVNFVTRGRVHYRMHHGPAVLNAGDLSLFWGGLPHQVVDTRTDSDFIAIHLPLIYFFRLRLAATLRQQLMHGATLITSALDVSDAGNFQRWSDYLLSGDKQRQEHALEELLLRIERVTFEPYKLLGAEEMSGLPAAPSEQHSFHNIGRICNFIAANFREEISATDIASSADIHPKYAMSVFKKSTGMTLNEYVSLLRLSYAQAMLINGDESVLNVAMDSGFGSLSAFNTSFRKISGMSPSSFRRGR